MKHCIICQGNTAVGKLLVSSLTFLLLLMDFSTCLATPLVSLLWMDPATVPSLSVLLHSTKLMCEYEISICTMGSRYVREVNRMLYLCSSVFEKACCYRIFWVFCSKLCWRTGILRILIQILYMTESEGRVRINERMTKCKSL